MDTALFFVFFLCGKPRYFVSDIAPTTISPVHEIEKKTELQMAIKAASDRGRVIRVDLEKLTGNVCL